MTRAHVPPQAAGNSNEVLSAVTLIKDGVMKSGRLAKGGLWLRGLCEQCNGLAGQRYDLAYGDFANRLRTYTRATRSFYLLERGAAPAVPVAPGLVARCVLFGMFAISPNLRTIFPDLARQLLHGVSHIEMPPRVSLRYALLASRRARLTGPISAHRVLTVRQDYVTLAEIYFSPLAWVLAPTDAALTPDSQSVLDSQGWPSADQWLQYGPDVTSVDLRNLARRVPVVQHPLANSRGDWIELYANEITPILEGYIPA